MVDGSIRFVTNNIAITTWCALGTARGGEVPDVYSKFSLDLKTDIFLDCGFYSR
jgi:hypothetical protein